jgi:hypothetical protein
MAMLPAELNQCLTGAERVARVVPITVKNSFHPARMDEGGGMARVDGVPNRLFAKLPGSLDLALKPDRPGKLGRRH